MRGLIGIILITFFTCGHADRVPGRIGDALNEKDKDPNKNSSIIKNLLDTVRNDSTLKAIPNKTNPKKEEGRCQ